jgi:hypothetical protein
VRADGEDRRGVEKILSSARGMRVSCSQDETNKISCNANIKSSTERFIKEEDDDPPVTMAVSFSLFVPPPPAPPPAVL